MSESPKCYSETHPVARKRHKCCECKGWIEPGEKYQHFSGVWDYAGTYKTCADCEAMREKADAETPHYDERLAFEELYEWAYENARKEFVAIKQKRGALIHSDWLEEDAG